jgi:hypothetical protein
LGHKKEKFRYGMSLLVKRSVLCLDISLGSELLLGMEICCRLVREIDTFSRETSELLEHNPRGSWQGIDKKFVD